MRIRRMTAKDLDRVMEIEGASFSDPWTRAMFVAELGNEISRIFVAERDRRLDGFIVTWVAVDEAHILDLAVDPAQRRCGIGEALTMAALERGQREGAAYMVLEVRRSNTGARRLYKALGFRVVGRRPGYYQDNGEDALVMMADLAGGGAAWC
ncbi:MAG: ribosomal protein S18-alanine N-acetyltransferase [Pseudomonadota bacterium]